MPFIYNRRVIFCCGSIWIEAANGCIILMNKRFQVIFMNQCIIWCDTGLTTIGKFAINNALNCSRIYMSFSHNHRAFTTMPKIPFGWYSIWGFCRTIK